MCWFRVILSRTLPKFHSSRPSWAVLGPSWPDLGVPGKPSMKYCIKIFAWFGHFAEMASGWLLHAPRGHQEAPSGPQRVPHDDLKTPPSRIKQRSYLNLNELLSPWSKRAPPKPSKTPPGPPLGPLEDTSGPLQDRRRTPRDTTPAPSWDPKLALSSGNRGLSGRKGSAEWRKPLRLLGLTNYPRAHKRSLDVDCAAMILDG